jgi:hypothetical protein
MKKIYIVITVLAFTVSSCKKSYLDLHPLDQTSPATFYQTDAQLKSAIAAAYVPMRDLMNYDYFCSEMKSDNTHYQPYPANRGTAYVHRENVSDWNDDSTNGVTNMEYYDCYLTIFRCNIVIDRAPDAVSATDAVKANVIGQAKFLRAWNYFKLVRLFGGVPLYLKEVKKADEAFVSRSTVDQVYAQIVADATDAASKLLPPAKFPQTGEATKGSATMLLAEVYMTQKKYAEAETLLASLAGMGYGLNANYADAFLTTNKNGKESIFEIQFQEGQTTTSAPSNFIYQFLPRCTTTTLITGTGTANGATGGWNTPSPDLIAAYEAGDKRLDASIGIAEGAYNASDLLVVSANKSIVGYVPAAGKVGVPYAKKYLHTPHVANNISNDDWPVYRYSDALLLLAEAQNEQSKSPLTALNAVRTRAGLAASAETNQATLRDIIARERRVELAFENHRWHDLQRTGTAIAVMTAYAVKAKSTYYTQVPVNAFGITANRLLFPIPQAEVGINPDLTQNPGY